MNHLLKLFTILAALSLSLYGGQKEFVVGFPQDNMNNPWRNAQVQAVKKELEKHKNIKFIYSNGEGKISKMVYDLENMVEDGIDLLIIGPKDKKVFTPIIDKIYKNGTPVVLLTRSIASENYTTFISPSDYNIGKNAAKELMKKGVKNILMLEGIPTASTAVDRKNGFLDELKNYKGVKVVSRVANYRKNQAITATEKALADGVTFDAIYAHSDGMASGARLALEKNGKDPKKIAIVGIDYINEAREAIKDGLQLATFTYPTCGTEGAKSAVKILNKEKVPKHQEIKSVKVTKKNVNRVKTVF